MPNLQDDRDRATIDYGIPTTRQSSAKKKKPELGKPRIKKVPVKEVKPQNVTFPTQNTSWISNCSHDY